MNPFKITIIVCQKIHVDKMTVQKFLINEVTSVTSIDGKKKFLFNFDEELYKKYFLRQKIFNLRKRNVLSST